MICVPQYYYYYTIPTMEVMINNIGLKGLKKLLTKVACNLTEYQACMGLKYQSILTGFLI